MQTFLIILGLLAIGAGVYYFLIKTGKIEDKDGDLIADDVEELVEDVVEEVAEAKAKVKKTVSKAKARVKAVKEEVEDVVEELSDVVSAIKGKVTKSKLNTMTKQQLLDAAKQDFDAELDGSVKKSTLVNKVYGLYHNK